MDLKSLGFYSVYLVKEQGVKAAEPPLSYKVQKPKVLSSYQKKVGKTASEPVEISVKESTEHLVEKKDVLSVQGETDVKMKLVEKVKIARAVEEEKSLKPSEGEIALKEEVLPKSPPVKKPEEAVKPAGLTPEKDKSSSPEPVTNEKIVPSAEELKEETMYIGDEEKMVVEEKKEEDVIAAKKEKVPEKVGEVEKPAEASNSQKVSGKDASSVKEKNKKLASAEQPSAVSKGKTSKEIYDMKKIEKATLEIKEEGVEKGVVPQEKLAQVTVPSKETIIAEGILAPALPKADMDTTLESVPGNKIMHSEDGFNEEAENIKTEEVPLAEISTSGKNRTPSQEDYFLTHDEMKKQTMAEIRHEEKEKKKPPLGIPISDVLLAKDIKIEILFHDAEVSNIIFHLLKKAHPMAYKKGDSGKPKEVDSIEENSETYISDIPKIKRSFGVSKADKGEYIFVIENKQGKAHKADVIFRLYEGKAGERIKEVKPLELPPHAIIKFKFIMPEAVFWDDEYYFTGNIENSDTLTKFNEGTGLVWKEEKEY